MYPCHIHVTVGVPYSTPEIPLGKFHLVAKMTRLQIIELALICCTWTKAARAIPSTLPRLLPSVLLQHPFCACTHTISSLRIHAYTRAHVAIDISPTCHILAARLPRNRWKLKTGIILSPLRINNKDFT